MSLFYSMTRNSWLAALEVIHRLYNFDYDAKVVQTLAFGQRGRTAVRNQPPGQCARR